MSIVSNDIRVGRRTFLQQGALVIAAASLPGVPSLALKEGPPLRVGLITDLHHADKPAKGTRYYQETLAKLEEAAGRYAQESTAFTVELGDLIDAADDVETEQRYLATISRAYAAICKDHHYVLGNHCVDMLMKEEFLGGVGQERSYYAFDRGGCHFVVLDACFRSDGQPYGRRNSHWTDANIPGAELEWLEADLLSTDKPTIVFVHQRLDVSTSHGVKNGPEVRRILEASGKVLAVFQGHSHQNDINEIAGLPYCTLVAMVEGSGAENNGYALLEIAPDGTLRLEGFRKQHSYDWPRSA